MEQGARDRMAEKIDRIKDSFMEQMKHYETWATDANKFIWNIAEAIRDLEKKKDQMEEWLRKCRVQSMHNSLHWIEWKE